MLCEATSNKQATWSLKKLVIYYYCKREWIRSLIALCIDDYFVKLGNKVECTVHSFHFI